MNKCFKANITRTFIEEDTASHNAGSYLQRLENELLVQIHIVHLDQIGQFIVSIFNIQHSFGKSVQAPIIPTPGFQLMIMSISCAQQSLNYDSLESSLHSTCGHDGGFYS